MHSNKGRWSELDSWSSAAIKTSNEILQETRSSNSSIPFRGSLGMRAFLSCPQQSLLQEHVGALLFLQQRGMLAVLGVAVRASVLLHPLKDREARGEYAPRCRPLSTRHPRAALRPLTGSEVTDVMGPFLSQAGRKL